MRMMKWNLLGATALLTSVALAQPTIDGTRDAEYGAPVVVQNTPTGFGDSNLGQVGLRQWLRTRCCVCLC
jgi:hypothetical protein